MKRIKLSILCLSWLGFLTASARANTLATVSVTASGLGTATDWDLDWQLNNGDTVVGDNMVFISNFESSDISLGTLSPGDNATGNLASGITLTDANPANPFTLQPFTTDAANIAFSFNLDYTNNYSGPANGFVDAFTFDIEDPMGNSTVSAGDGSNLEVDFSPPPVLYITPADSTYGISVTVTVAPEPPTWPLAAAMLLGLFGYRRLRSRAQRA
jgi:hypothetical protein